jgi:hypothetical protein
MFNFNKFEDSWILITGQSGSLTSVRSILERRQFHPTQGRLTLNRRLTVLVSGAMAAA